MANRTVITNAAASFLSSALVNLPLLPGMHPTTGWLLCQKMRSTLSSRSLRHLRWGLRCHRCFRCHHCCCRRHCRRNHPPSLPRMHPTTGWLLCQKMRSTFSLRPCCYLCWGLHRRHRCCLRHRRCCRRHLILHRSRCRLSNPHAFWRRAAGVVLGRNVRLEGGNRTAGDRRHGRRND